jgi:glucose-6-phosphate 1-dehydrogenase
VTLTLLTNPLREGLRLRRTPEPCVVVIFGATGDLTRRKLVPALYDLARDQLLPGGFSVVGFARTDLGTDGFESRLHDSVAKYARTGPVDGRVWSSFEQGISYFRGSYDDAESFRMLGERLDEIDRERGTSGNRLFYLATPPSSYEPIIHNLGESGLSRETASTGWRRIIVEKPFGHDLRSAQELNSRLARVFEERQVFRIDHYLGKETVQNILVFRLSNGIFEPIWNRRYVDNVQITVAESIGVEGRGGYYEEAGALRDMVQNHMLQLVSLVAMEPPVAFEADAVRDEKVKVLRAIRPLEAAELSEETVRGQYASGWIDGQPVPGYREEPGVSPDSRTETYVAMRMLVDNWRWADVPFYLRVGKRLPKRTTEIAIQFNRAPHLLFGRTSAERPEPSVLVLRIQPDEGIALQFGAKLPGPTIRVRSVAMDFRYGTSFGVTPPDAYERLLLDCMLGDSTLFTRRDEVEAAWLFVTRMLEGWSALNEPLSEYEAGTWGPTDADRLIQRNGRSWRRP